MFPSGGWRNKMKEMFGQKMSTTLVFSQIPNLSWFSSIKNEVIQKEPQMKQRHENGDLFHMLWIDVSLEEVSQRCRP